MISKHFNWDYAGGSPNVPVAVGDRLYAQDQARDFWFILDRLGLGISDLIGGGSKFILSGGLVTTLPTSIAVSTGIGYTQFLIPVPTSGSVPPSLANETGTVRIPLGGSYGIVALGGVLDGVTINYIKIKYVELDGLTRQKAKALGTYAFEKTPSTVVTISPAVPTAYELCLGTVVGNGIANATYSTNSRDFTLGLLLSSGVIAVSANYTYDGLTGATFLNCINSPTITLANSSAMLGREVTIKNSGTGIVTVVPTITPNVDKIDGLTTMAIGQRGSVTLTCNGTTWLVKQYDNSTFMSFRQPLGVSSAVGGTFTTTTAWGYAYCTPSEEWRLKFFILGQHTANANNTILAINGVQFASAPASLESGGQAGAWGASALVLTSTVGACHPNSLLQTITLYSPSNTTKWWASGDFALAVKPTWVP